MPSKGVIEIFHEKLGGEIHSIISADIKMIPSIKEWHKVPKMGVVPWRAFAVGSTPVESALRENGDRVHVFSVSEVADQSDLSVRGWVSWFEKWSKTGRDQYDLISAGWTAFWGPPYDEYSKIPVLRAEWDQDLEGENKDMGQPHWHVDRAIPVSSESGMTAELAISAGEIAPTITGEFAGDNPTVLRMGRVHLAMATWEPESHPQCWQRKYSGECDELLDWATKTLHYLKSQLDTQRGFVSLGSSDIRSF